MKKHLTLLVVIALIVGALPALTSAQAPSLLIWTDETRAAVIEELGASFSEEYGVELVVQQLGFGDIRDQLRIAGPAGEGPDVIIGAHDWLGELVTNGLLAPVELGDKAEEFNPGALSALTWYEDSQLYGVPYAIENIALFYNTDLVPTPPETWDEAIEISKALMDEGKAEYGFIRQIGDPYHFYPIQTAFGGYIFGVDEEGNYDAMDVGVDNEGSIAALQWLQGLIKDGMMPSSLEGGDAEALFQDGKAAMYITGPWNLDRFKTAGVPFGIAALPAGPDGDPGRPFLGVQAFMVSAFSENPLLAQAFLTEWVATEDVQYALYEKGNRTPAYLAAAERVEDPYLAGLTAAGAVGQAMPAIPAMSAVWTAWTDAITLAMQNPDQDAVALATAAAETIRAAAAGE
ncbi:MAG: maltose ABC transporter substrate-binding protein [Anaerolineae bacterium]|nr:maltose ABC transporter substrate-binding protein [Anaerolineae bacterium]